MWGRCLRRRGLHVSLQGDVLARRHLKAQAVAQLPLSPCHLPKVSWRVAGWQVSAHPCCNALLPTEAALQQQLAQCLAHASKPPSMHAAAPPTHLLLLLPLCRSQGGAAATCPAGSSMRTRTSARASSTVSPLLLQPGPYCLPRVVQLGATTAATNQRGGRRPACLAQAALPLAAF